MVQKKYAGADPGFFVGGRAVAYNFTRFPQKMHKIEKVLTCKSVVIFAHYSEYQNMV